MKTFFAAAALATVAFTTDISDDMIAEIEKDIQEIGRLEEECAAQAYSEGEYETTKEIAEFVRKLQCWWADLEPKTEECARWEDVQRDVCTSHGRIWIDEWFQCVTPDSPDWNYYQCVNSPSGLSPEGGDCASYWFGGMEKFGILKRGKNLSKALKKKILTKYRVTADGPELERIGAEQAAINEEGARLFDEQSAEINRVVEVYEPMWEDLFQRGEAADAQASEDFANYLVQNVEIDGVKLADIVGTPDQWVAKRKTMKQRKVMQEGGDPSRVTVEWEGPSQQEIEAWLQDTVTPALDRVGKTAEEIAQIGEEIDRAAKQEFEDRTRFQFESIGMEAQAIGRDFGESIKASVTSAQVQTSLLAAQAEAERSNSIKTGLAAGVVGAVAGCAVFALTNRSKSVNAQEQPLL